MYVIIGANGYLGAYFVKNILSETEESIIAVSRSAGAAGSEWVQWVTCDITKEDQVNHLNKEYLLKSERNKIVYLAAYHHPDLVEQNPKLAWDTNITSLTRFLNTAEHVECLFYPSSDSVYGESYHGHRFTEDERLNPVNRYGRHKCVAETLVTAYGYNVVRFPFLIAPSIVQGKKHFYDHIVETIQKGAPIEMFCDSYRSALNFDTAAKLTISLMETFCEKYPPILNVCGDDALSKYDIGLMIAEHLGLPRDLIRPVSVAASNGIFKVKRAGSTLMDNSLLKRTLGLDEIKLIL